MQALTRGHDWKDKSRGVRFCYVISTYLESGVPVCDVVDEFGCMWFKCNIRGEGADGDSYTYKPPTLKTIDPASFDYNALLQQPKALLLLMDGSDPPKAIVAGGFLSTQAAIKFDGGTKTEPPDAKTSAPKLASVSDKIDHHAGAEIRMLGSGGVVIEHREVDGPVRIELKAGASVRTAYDGGEAADNLSTAGAVRDAIAALTEKYNALVSAVNAFADGASAATGDPVKISGAATALANLKLGTHTAPTREALASVAYEVPPDTLAG